MGPARRKPSLPELPEVETVARGLRSVALGKEIEAVETSGVPSNRLPLTSADAAMLVGGRLAAVLRRGKYLVAGVVFDQTVAGPEPLAPSADAALLDPAADLARHGASLALVIHLGMSGQLRWADATGEPRPPHTHLVITFSAGYELRFVDPRRFGFASVVPPSSLASRITALVGLGPDAMQGGWTIESLAAALHRSRARLKTVLLDQSVIAGLGNIYTDEILFRARIRWDRPANSLSLDEVMRLFSAMQEVIAKAVDLRGSTLADAQYRDLFGSPGSFQNHHLAYGRAGLGCHRCGEILQAERFGGRTTTFCPTCQL